ncbi:MAG TPA: hypothetical protein VK914_09500 [bacterium]|jgi:hypothetical protein|nr:hypothetical protein [bacterium]
MVTVAIYNSAGELVRSLYQGGAANPANQVQVLESVGPGGALQVDVTGLDGQAGSDLIWNATNNGGQSVAAGVYTVQVATTNPFGQVQTQTKMVAVTAGAGPVSLGIFNSAGELVANLSAEMAGQDSEPVSMSLAPPDGQAGNGVVAVSGAAAGSGSGGLIIKITFANGDTKTVLWDGLGTQGQPLQPGNYLATLYQAEPGSDTVVKSQPFVLLGAADGSANSMAQSAIVVPNPVDGDWFTVQFQPDATDSAAARLYTLDGGVAAEGASNGPGSLRLSGDWSGGVYLLDFEVHGGPGGTLARRVLKVAIVR